MSVSLCCMQDMATALVLSVISDDVTSVHTLLHHNASVNHKLKVLG